MKRKLRFLLPIAIGALCLSGCTFFSISDNEEEEDIVFDPVVLGTYYEGYNLDQSGSRLEKELQKMCFEKHTQWVTYGQLGAYYSRPSNGSRESIEAVKSGSNVNQYFYTDKRASSTAGTREHVWPCAASNNLWTHTKPGAGKFSAHYVDNSHYVGGGSDLYHVRLCERAVNTARGDSDFMDFEDDEYKSLSYVTQGEDGGKYTLKLYGADKVGSKYQYADLCEPDDNMKGDVARIILYIWIHYSDRGITPEGAVGQYTDSSNVEREFKFEDMVSSGLSLSMVMGPAYSTSRIKEKLLQWHNMDKPSNTEKLRNNTVQKIQGNRNPFVDYPELVEKVLYN